MFEESSQIFVQIFTLTVKTFSTFENISLMLKKLLLPKHLTQKGHFFSSRDTENKESF